MRRVFRRLIRRVNTTEWSVSWFEVLPGEDPGSLADRLERDSHTPDRPEPQSGESDGTDSDRTQS